MVMSVLLNFIFLPSPLVMALSVISLVSLAKFGYSEIQGNHFNFSKFWNDNDGKTTDEKPIKLSGRAGFLFIYTPSFLVGTASFIIFTHEGLRFTLLHSAITLHYFKRVLEVLYVHKFSGPMILNSAVPITLSYLTSVVFMIYAQHLTRELPEPSINLMYPGIGLFLVGITGNFYHHYLLSKLRGKGEKKYKIPKGGLFELVICPHYLFEIIVFYGVCFISQTLYSFAFAVGTTLYLLGRSYTTRKWYLSKFEDFPNHVKAVIPFVF